MTTKNRERHQRPPQSKTPATKEKQREIDASGQEFVLSAMMTRTTVSVVILGSHASYDHDGEFDFFLHFPC